MLSNSPLLLMAQLHHYVAHTLGPHREGFIITYTTELQRSPKGGRTGGGGGGVLAVGWDRRADDYTSELHCDTHTPTQGLRGSFTAPPVSDIRPLSLSGVCILNTARKENDHTYTYYAELDGNVCGRDVGGR